MLDILLFYCAHLDVCDYLDFWFSQIFCSFIWSLSLPALTLIATSSFILISALVISTITLTSLTSLTFRNRPCSDLSSLSHFFDCWFLDASLVKGYWSWVRSDLLGIFKKIESLQQLSNKTYKQSEKNDLDQHFEQNFTELTKLEWWSIIRCKCF